MSEKQREDDVDTDEALANSRATGGVDEGNEDEEAVTTGPSPSDEYVGRVAGQDLGYAGETGAEARAERG